MACVLGLLAGDEVRLEARRAQFWGGLSSNLRAFQLVFVSSVGGRARKCRLIVFWLWSIGSITALSTASSGFCFVANCFIIATSAHYSLYTLKIFIWYSLADTFCCPVWQLAATS